MGITLAFASSLFPFASWIIYAFLSSQVEKRRPSLSLIMSKQRRRWVHNAIHRDTPLDAILASNLMSSVSFFASTTVLIILALFAVFGQLESVLNAIQMIESGPSVTASEVETHLFITLIMFGTAFLLFTLSLRQFNHFCIMLGAADPSENSDPKEVDVITKLNTLGARNFNQGIRLYYFAISMVAWFMSPAVSFLVTAVILASIFYREFFSSARTLVSGLD